MGNAAVSAAAALLSACALAAPAAAQGIASADLRPLEPPQPQQASMSEPATAPFQLDVLSGDDIGLISLPIGRWERPAPSSRSPVPDWLGDQPAGLPRFAANPFGPGPADLPPRGLAQSVALGWDVNEALRLRTAGWKRSIDLEQSYFAISAEAEWAVTGNAGLWIGYDLFRDLLQDELPDTDLAREGMFVEFRMSF